MYWGFSQINLELSGRALIIWKFLKHYQIKPLMALKNWTLAGGLTFWKISKDSQSICQDN